MKRAIKLAIALLILIAVMLAAIVAILHTQYATPIVNSLLSSYIQRIDVDPSGVKASPSQLSTVIPTHIENVRYEFPYHFIFQGISLKKPHSLDPNLSNDSTQNENQHYINQVDVWLNPQLIKENKLVIDSLLIDGLNLQHGLTQTEPPKNILISQLAINNLDYSDDNFNARGVNLQIENPTWQHAQQRLPFGNIQLSAEQIYWQGEALNQLLLNGHLKPKNSTIFGLSFEWRDAQISGQAEQLEQRWSLINVTLNKLNLNQQQMETILSKPWKTLAPSSWHLNSVDILNSDLAWDNIHLINLDASIENLTFPIDIWQQQAGYLSLNAESIIYHQEQWVEPSFQANFSPNSILISNFNASLLQGFVRFNGRFSPTSAELENLSINGVKWIAEKKEATHWLWSLFNAYQTLTIQQLNIERSQFIQLATPPYWQISGVSAEGQSLALIKAGKKGMWNGSLLMSANSASYQNIVASQALFEMESQHGNWQLKRLFFPLPQGYIEANANMAFSKPSQPWQLSLSVDGMNIEPLLTTMALPFEIHGLTEFELHASGLAGDELMFAHSLTGQLQGSIRHASVSHQQIEQQPLASNTDQYNTEQHNTGLQTLSLKDQPFTESSRAENLQAKNLQTEKPQTAVADTFIPVTISEMNIQMDRGRINVEKIIISGENILGQLEGEYDLAQPAQNDLKLEYIQACQKQTGVLTSRAYQTENQCLPPPNTVLPDEVTPNP